MKKTLTLLFIAASLHAFSNSSYAKEAVIEKHQGFRDVHNTACILEISNKSSLHVDFERTWPEERRHAEHGEITIKNINLSKLRPSFRDNQFTYTVSEIKNNNSKIIKIKMLTLDGTEQNDLVIKLINDRIESYDVSKKGKSYFGWLYSFKGTCRMMSQVF